MAYWHVPVPTGNSSLNPDLPCHCKTGPKFRLIFLAVLNDNIFWGFEVAGVYGVAGMLN